MKRDIVTYLSNLTGYSFTKEQILSVAYNRGFDEETDITTLTLRDRNLLLADLLFIIFTSPSSSGALTKQHGDYSVTIGSTQITDKADICKLMNALYENPDKELGQILSSYTGGVYWVDEKDWE
jgi:hypothetical protein